MGEWEQLYWEFDYINMYLDFTVVFLQKDNVQTGVILTRMATI